MVLFLFLQGIPSDAQEEMSSMQVRNLILLHWF